MACANFSWAALHVHNIALHYSKVQRGFIMLLYYKRIKYKTDTTQAFLLTSRISLPKYIDIYMHSTLHVQRNK